MTTPDTHRASHPADFAFASLLSGALGSAAIALFFLLIDSMRGSPFSTPSTMGSVLFLGADPSEAMGARTDLVAAYTLVHLFAFVLLGTAATWIWTKTNAMARHPLALATAVLTALTLGAIGVDLLLAPGVLAAIGAIPLVAANTFAALVMGLFIHRTLEDADALKAGAFDQPALVPVPVSTNGRRTPDPRRRL